MVDPIIIDLVFLAVLIAAFFVGRARGIIKMVWSLAAWMITLVLALTLAAPFGELAENSSYARSAQARLAQSVENSLLESNEIEYGKYSTENASNYAGIPRILRPNRIPGVEMDYTGATEQTVAEIAQKIAEYAIHILAKPAAFILLMLLIRLVLAVLYRILHIASKLPVINGVNKMLGGMTGLIGVLFAIHLVLAFIAVFVGGEWGLLIGRTYLVKYFYNDNILLYLIK